MGAGFVSSLLYRIALHNTGVFPVCNQQPKPVILTDVNMSGVFRKNMICQDVMPPVSPKINKLLKQKKTFMATALETTQHIISVVSREQRAFTQLLLSTKKEKNCTHLSVREKLGKNITEETKHRFMCATINHSHSLKQGAIVPNTVIG